MCSVQSPKLNIPLATLQLAKANAPKCLGRDGSTYRSAKIQAIQERVRHIWLLTLGEKLGLFLSSTPVKILQGCFICINKPRNACLFWVILLCFGAGLQMWGIAIGVYTFAVFKKTLSEGLWTRILLAAASHPQLSKNQLCPPTPFHLNVAVGLRRPWYTKLRSKAVTWLTAERFPGDGQLCVGGHGKNRMLSRLNQNREEEESK